MKMNYLKFNEVSSSGKTKKWAAIGSDGSLLLNIAWYSHWRRYVAMDISSNIVLDANCLREIAAFCEHKSAEHRAQTMKSRAGWQPRSE